MVGEKPRISRKKMGQAVRQVEDLAMCETHCALHRRSGGAHCVIDQASNAHVARCAVVLLCISNQDNQYFISKSSERSSSKSWLAPEYSFIRQLLTIENNSFVVNSW